MAYPPIERTKLEVALASGVMQKEACKALCLSKNTARRWMSAQANARANAASAQYRKRNPEAVAVRQRNYRENNREFIRECSRRSMRKRRERTPELVREKDRKYSKTKYKRHKGKHHARAALYRARKRDVPGPASPIEKMMCDNYYKLARELTEQTGIPHEVDHIWPVSRGGPHLPWNLQILTQEENRKKRDKI
jgi:5-methylcytosine-specific restriction endonuclease McrA